MANDLGKLILRLTLGVLILLHGIAKIIGGTGGIEKMLEGAGLPSFLAAGVYVGEVLAPILVIIGLYARVGAALIVVNMLFAVLLAHRADLSCSPRPADGRSSCKHFSCSRPWRSR